MSGLTYKGYRSVISYSDEDEVFFGKVLGLNDLVSFEGTSVKEIKAAFREAVDDYLATCESLGKEPEKEYKGSFNVRVSPDLHRRAAHHAQLQNMSLNKLVEEALTRALHVYEPSAEYAAKRDTADRLHMAAEPDNTSYEGSVKGKKGKKKN